MKNFKFEITETLQKTINISADNESDAYKIIKDMYRNEEIVLNSEDYVKTEINFIE